MILQAHIDMVAQKTLESAHDFSRDPIRPQISGDRVCAGQTTPDASSQLYTAVKTAFAARLGREPKTEVWHAGLECGVLQQRLPDMEMVSFGPTIEGGTRRGSGWKLPPWPNVGEPCWRFWEKAFSLRICKAFI